MLNDNERMELLGATRRLEEEAPEPTSTEYLVNALQVYGSFFVVAFPLFCIIRKQFPKTYAVRQWVPVIKTSIAENQFGYITWLWKLYSFSSDDLRANVGLDAICFLRFMSMGFRLACLGAFNSIWLFPVYATANNDGPAEDLVDQVAINNLPDGSKRFIATVVGSYVFFGYTMYTILKEFRWFITQRHVWLREYNQRNYTILVRNIPKELRSDTLLMEHFQMVYGKDRVLQANVCLHISHLESRVARRKACAANLEHALAELAIYEKRPKHLAFVRSVDEDRSDSDRVVKRKKKDLSEVDSIDYFTTELERLNGKIDDEINAIEKKQRPRFLRSMETNQMRLSSSTGTRMHSAKSMLSSHSSKSGNDAIDESDGADEDSRHDDEKMDNSLLKLKRKTSVAFVSSASDIKKSAKSGTTKVLKHAKSSTIHKIDKAKDLASNLLGNEASSIADDAGFVTFSSLVAVYGALQMSQHDEPFVLDCETAPDIPKHIFWGNVGKDKEALQTGRIISYAASITLCLFWTFIVTSIVNLTNVTHLREQFPSLGETLDNNPWIQWFLNLVSPLLLLILNTGLLPILLKSISRFEFPASDSLLEASTFWKMAVFHILQSFFVTLISGAFVTGLGSVLANPAQLIDLLASHLPEQSAYFISLLIVSTCVGTMVELFRIVPLSQFVGRLFIGRRLTEKERNQNCGILKPRSVVDKFYFSRVQARFVLYFMVLFVYSSVSPLVNWFCMFFFLFLGSVYRHQFVYNYPGTPDSGGQIWLSFMHVLLACIVISQLTLLGFLGLKKAAIAAPMMVPLLIATILFILYLHERHFKIGRNLPARACLRQDMENNEDEVDFSSFKNEYKNPALMARFLDVDWDSGKDEKKVRNKKTDLSIEEEENGKDLEHADLSAKRNSSTKDSSTNADENNQQQQEGEKLNDEDSQQQEDKDSSEMDEERQQETDEVVSEQNGDSYGAWVGKAFGVK